LERFKIQLLINKLEHFSGGIKLAFSAASETYKLIIVTKAQEKVFANHFRLVFSYSGIRIMATPLLSWFPLRLVQRRLLFCFVIAIFTMHNYDTEYNSFCFVHRPDTFTNENDCKDNHDVITFKNVALAWISVHFIITSC